MIPSARQADVRRERLRKTIRNAREFLNHVRERDLALRCGEVHMRPSSAGVALISLHPDSPQLGEGGLSPKQAAERLATFSISRVPGRSTAEKELQAFIVAEAYRHARRLHCIEPVGQPTWFITDELRLPHDNGGDVICDLVGVGLRGGRMVPVVIELKSERSLSRLVEQVTSYSRVIEQERELFAELAGVLLGRQVALVGEAERWIVWPAPSGLERHDDDLAARGIRRVSYQTGSTGYTFTW